MTIDYDRLRALGECASPGPWRTDEHPYMDGQSVYDAEGLEIAQHLSGNNAELVALAPDMARELLRLRDEITKTRDRIKDEIERTPAELQAAKITLHTERVHMLGLCAHLLSGDYE